MNFFSFFDLNKKMSITLNWEEFDLNKLSLVTSGKNLKLKYDGKDFKLKTDILFCPFDCRINMQSWQKFKQWSISCNIINDDFLNFTNNFNEKLKQLLYGLNLMDNNTTYRNLVYTSGNYSSLSFNFKRTKTGSFASFIFDNDKEQIAINDDSLSNVLTRKYIKAVVECEKIYIYNEKVGSIWDLDQCKIIHQEENEPETNIHDDKIVSCLIDD